ncbi:MAG: type II secretion system protein [Verrucomicrobiota bacterium]
MSPAAPFPPPPGIPLGAWRHPPRRDRGFTLVEIAFGMMVSIFMGFAILNSLIVSQRFAARARLLTNARAIVQRNIDAASGVAFTGSTSTPTILAVTSGTGVVCDDDGGAPTENIQLLRSGTNILVSGTLRRIVTSEPVTVSGTASDPSVIVQRVTFQIDYNYLNIPYSYSETTLRSADSQ